MKKKRKAIGSTCYYEFSMGKWDNCHPAFWKDDSLNISDDAMYTLGLDSLISSVVSSDDPFGETEISKEQWGAISIKANEIGGELLEAICEAAPWAEENFRQHRVFTIVGL